MENSSPNLHGEMTGPEENLNLRHYWHVILERRWLVITTFISVFILCLIYLYRAPKIYQAKATLQINREALDPLGTREPFAFEGREQDYLQTQYKNLQSRTLIEKVIASCKLKEDPRYAKKQDIYRAVFDDLTIAPIRLSRLVEIKVEHTVPKQAKLITSTLIKQFVEDNLANKKLESQTALDGLRLEVGKQNQAVDAADRDLQRSIENFKNISVEESKNITILALKGSMEELAKSQARAAVAAKQHSKIQEMISISNRVDLFTIPQVAMDREIQEMRITLSREEAELEGLRQRYKDGYPTVKEKRKAIESLKQSIGITATNIIRSIANEAETTAAQVEGLQAVVKDWEAKQILLGKNTIDYEALKRDADIAKSLYMRVLEAKTQLEIAINNKVNNMFIVDDAVEPLRPIKPRVALTLFLGFFGGLAVAVGLAFFVNYLDDSIKTQDDVEVYLRQPFLGYVPNIKSNSVVERDLQSHMHPQSTAAEGFRTIRAAISLMPKADKFRTLVVTSTIPSEGKSLLASNLAIVTAQTGLKTLLVDADLRRPSVHKAFQLHSPVGLSAFLLENVSSVDEIIHTTEVPNLDVVCAGAIPSNPSELSGSKRMRQFIQETARNYDRIFIDCPPVSAVSDPLVMAAMSDGVVFLTKFNKIRREHARKSIQRIQDAGIHLVGVVLNDIDFEGKDSYYYSYYYYQNRYYSSHYRSDLKKHAPAPKESTTKS